jgi:hypothetical protein
MVCTNLVGRRARRSCSFPVGSADPFHPKATGFRPRPPHLSEESAPRSCGSLPPRPPEGEPGKPDRVPEGPAVGAVVSRAFEEARSTPAGFHKPPKWPWSPDAEARRAASEEALLAFSQRCRSCRSRTDQTRRGSTVHRSASSRRIQQRTSAGPKPGPAPKDWLLAPTPDECRSKGCRVPEGAWRPMSLTTCGAEALSPRSRTNRVG